LIFKKQFFFETTLNKRKNWKDKDFLINKEKLTAFADGNGSVAFQFLGWKNIFP
jgi:hypothetical protein